MQMWVATPEAQTKWFLVFTSQVLHDPMVLRGSRNVFTTDLVWSLHTLLSAFCILSCVHCPWWYRVQLTLIFLEPRQFSLSFFTYQEALLGTSTTSLVQMELYRILICHCSLFPLLASCDRMPMDLPTTAPFQKLFSFFRILSHPSICFSHSPISSFHSKAWDSLWSLCYGDKQRTIKMQREQLILH